MSTTERLGEVKRQHYVPRMLLRNFSKDGTRISLVVDGKRIDGTSIKNQCQEDYFYGADNIMEKSFGNSEAKMASFLGDLAPSRFVNLTDDDLRELQLFLAYQYHRTRGAAEHLSKFLGSFLAEAVKGTALLNKGVDTRGDLEDVEVRFKNAQNEALWVGTKLMPVITDLSVKLISTDRAPGFVIADNPVVAYNQFAEHHPILTHYPTSTNLAHKGLQLFLPLSPGMLLALFDGGTYQYGGNGFVCKAGPADVAFMNRMQAVNAMSSFYFHEDRMDASSLSKLVDVRARHPSIYSKKTVTSPMTRKPDGTVSQFVITHFAQLRLGAKLSFVRTIDGHSYEDYEGPSVPPRSWELIKVAEQFGKLLEEEVAEARATRATATASTESASETR